MTQARLVISKTVGTAPFAVHFDASNTTDNLIADTFRSLQYQFNFGDPSSGNWQHSGKPKNTQNGAPIAAHVYDNPGTYTAQVAVGNDVAQVQITVAAATTTWAGADTICLSTGADFTGAPIGADNRTVSSWPTFESNKRYMLRRGDNFTSLGGLRVGQVDNTRVCAFGAGAKPIVGSVELQPNNTGHPKSGDTWLKNTDLIGVQATRIIHGLTGHDVLIYQNDVISQSGGGAIMLADGFRGRVGTTYQNMYTAYNVFAIENNNHSNGFGGNGGRGQLIWMGNDIGNTSQHNLRIQTLIKGIVSHNNFRGYSDANGKAILKLHSMGLFRVMDVKALREADNAASRQNVVSDNVMNSSNSTGIWITTSIKPQNGNLAEGVEDVIMERNRHILGAQATTAGAFGGRRITTRLEVIEPGCRMPSGSSNEGGLPTEWRGPYFIDVPMPAAPDGTAPPIDPPITCPEGHELIDGECVEIPPIDPPIACPEGYELIDGECVEIPPIDPPTEPCTCVDGAQGVQGIQGVQGVQGLPGADGNDAEMDPLMDEALDFYDYVKAYFQP